MDNFLQLIGINAHWASLSPFSSANGGSAAFFVIANGADHERVRAKASQMPGHVERRAAEYGTAVGKSVEKHLAEQLQGRFAHAAPMRVSRQDTVQG